MNPAAKQLLAEVARRLVWVIPAFYMVMSVALWVANTVAPQAIGPVTNYTIVVSLIAAVTFGSLYVLVSALRPTRREPTAME